MTSLSCADILAGRAPQDTPVTVKGWVRTRRDSKAGISFVHVSDGSSFHPVQVVAPSTLPNYADEVLHLTAGCAVEATGSDRARRPRRASRSRCRRTAVKRARLGRRPGHLPDPAQAAHAGVPARGRAPAAAHQRHRRGRRACATRSRRRSTASSTSDGFFWVNTPIITASDAEGAGELFRVSTLDLANLPRTRGRQDRLRAGLLRPRGVPHRVGPAQRRDLLPGAVEGLHVRPDVPRRELEHQPPPRRVLDDRAGDRVRRPCRQRRPRRGAAQAHLQRRCSTSAPTTWRSSRSASRRA